MCFYEKNGLSIDTDADSFLINIFWFYDMKADGFSLDDKRAKIGENDIPDIVGKWKYRKELSDNKLNSRFFYVSRKEIEESGYDLSINHYKVTDYEEISYETPTVILKKIENLEKEILAGISELKIL